MTNRKIKPSKIFFSFALLISLVVFSFAVFSNIHVKTVFAVTGSQSSAQNQTTNSESSEQVPNQAGSAEENTEEHAEDTGVVGLFGLDWKLFLAQLVNFAVVLFVLWRWVFKPVVSGMEARTQKIEQSIITADQIAKEKQEFEQWKAKEMVNARHEATTIISEAKQTAITTKDQILDQAKLEQQAILDQSKKELELQKQKTLEEAKANIADLVILSTEKLLRAKLDGKTDAKLIQTVLTETDKDQSQHS